MIVHNGNIVVNNGRWIIPERIKYKVNLIQTTGGTISAVPITGVNGTTVTLSNTPLNIEYNLDSYSITGSTLYDGNKFKFNNSDVDVTATWNYTPVPVPWDTVGIGGQLWSKDISINDGGGGISTRNNKTYYTSAAALRIDNYVRANYIGWRVATRDDWQALFVTSSVDAYNGPFPPYSLRSTYGWEVEQGTDNFGFEVTNNSYMWQHVVSGSLVNTWYDDSTAYWNIYNTDSIQPLVFSRSSSSTPGNKYTINVYRSATLANIRLVKDMI